MLTTKLALVLGTALAMQPSAPPPRAASRPSMEVAQAWQTMPPGPRRWHGPPPPAFEEVRPRSGYVWIEGGYEWHHGRYVRLPGHWERERVRRRLQPGHWEPADDHYVWVRGGWIDVEPIRGQNPPPPMAPPPPPTRAYGRISISGQILDQYGRPAAGIAVVLAGTSEGTAVTDEYGHYEFAGLVPGSYAVRPGDPRCAFGPDVMNLNNLGTNAIQNFNANCR